MGGGGPHLKNISLYFHTTILSSTKKFQECEDIMVLKFIQKFQKSDFI